MEEEKRKAYSEVVEILKLIEDEEKIEKIPFEVIELIKGNSDPSYKPQISKEIPLEEQNLKDQTYIILGWISNKYWGEEVLSIKSTETEDIEAKQEEFVKEENNIRNAGVYNDIEPSILNAEVPEEPNRLPILLSSLKWYQKIKIQVIKIFKKLFKVNNMGKEGVNE